MNEIDKLKETIKEQEEIIRTLNNRYLSIFGHSKVGIAYVDDEGNFLDVNSRYCEILAYEEEELLKMSFQEITHKDDIKKDLRVYEKSKKDGSDSYSLEKRYIKKDGSLLYAEIFVKHQRLSDGTLSYSTIFVTDINKRKKIQDNLIEQTKTAQMYLDIVDVMILGLNNKGVINLVNRKTCEILGFEEYELLGRNWFKNYLTNENVIEIYEYFIKIMNHEADLEKRHVNEIKCKEGIRTISWKNRVLKDSSNKIIGIISSGEDVTEILKLEEENRRNQKALHNQSKMASMGEMLRNISHQWRQPLSTISTAASGIKLQKEFGTLSDEDFYENMDAIVNTTQYLSQTINDFQNFFKPKAKIDEIECKSFFQNIVNLITPNYKESNINLVISQNNDYKLNSFYHELIQVIMNILNNSRDAFEENNLDNRVVFLDTFSTKAYLTVYIKDNAGGISNDIINRVFEPYFTTKHQSLGTGIGLYMVKDIIEKNLDGKVELYNELIEYNGIKREGAVFKLIIPNL